MEVPFLGSARRRLRDSAPVVALRRELYERRFAGTQQWRNLARGLYGSFAEARADAPTTLPTGYLLDDDEFERRTAIEAHDYPAMFWLRPHVERGCTLLDFGGHVGLQYRLYQRYLRYPPTLRWIVAEQPAVVARGRAALAAQPAPHLSFTDDPAAEPVDVLFTAGCIQSVEEPLPALIGRLPRRPAAVLINKLPLVEAPTRVTLQNTGRSFTPVWLYQDAAFVASMTAIGYRLVDRWRCPERHMTVPFHPDYRVDAFAGLYFEAR